MRTGDYHPAGCLVEFLLLCSTNISGARTSEVKAWILIR